MFHKYNLVLRAGNVLRSSSEQLPQQLQEDFDALCMGNKYVTTLHVINSCIVKLSKLSVVRKVYRGLARGKLPDAFWVKDKYGVRGGFETGNAVRDNAGGGAPRRTHRTQPVRAVRFSCPHTFM